VRTVLSLAAAPPVEGPQPPWRRVVAVGIVGLLLAGLMLGLQFVRLDRNHLGGGPSAPFFVGTAWHLDEELAARHIDVVVRPGKGYDGQWYLGLAYDPLLREHLADGFDMPRYRARRPLLAMAGWLLAAGQTAAVPAGLLAALLLSVGAGCAASARLLAAAGLSRWWGLGFAVIPGVIVGVMFGTAEPLGVALAAVGLSLVLDRRLVAAALAFAGAGLTKETFLGFAAVAAVWLLLGSRDRLAERLRAAATVLLPGAVLLGAWWWYAGRMVVGGRNDDAGLAAIAPPFAGWGHTLARIASGGYVPDAPVGLLGPASLVATFVLLVAGVALSLRPRTLLAWTGLLMGIYGLVIAGGQLDRFLSACRALAPCVLGAGLAVASVVALSRSGRFRHDVLEEAQGPTRRRAPGERAPRAD
jgi:hypothetical protein